MRSFFEINRYKGGAVLKFALLIFSLVILSGCSNSRSKLVQKRLYRPGWNVNLPSKQIKQGDAENVLGLLGTIEAAEMKDSISEESELNEVPLVNTEGDYFALVPNIPNHKLKRPFINQLDNLEVNVEETQLNHVHSQETKDEPTAPIITAGVIALIIALINLLFFMWVPFLGVLSAILSIVFAVKALKLDNKNSKLYGITSLVISAFTIFISFLITFAVMNGLQLFGNI